MLKQRLISCLVLQDSTLVQSFEFQRFLPVGKARIAVEFMANWDIDEIIILDITATSEGRKPDPAVIMATAKNCFVPLTVGGGISSIDDVERTIRAGADKISMNSAALADPNLITEIARRFGNQCVIAAMDVKNGQSGHQVMAARGKTATGKHPVEWARECEERGAGEILLQSIDRDGSRSGYDLELIRAVSRAVRIPVIAFGGVGTMRHFFEGLEAGAAAVAAANIFQHVEHSTIVAKSFLKSAGANIRLSTLAKYTTFAFDEMGRVLKKEDTELEDIWLEKFRSENI